MRTSFGTRPDGTVVLGNRDAVNDAGRFEPLPPTPASAYTAPGVANVLSFADRTFVTEHGGFTVVCGKTVDMQDITVQTLAGQPTELALGQVVHQDPTDPNKFMLLASPDNPRPVA